MSMTNDHRNSRWGKALLRRKNLGECRVVPHATASDLGDFQPERSKCHDNVDRWCDENPDDKPLRGWLVTSGTIFDKHSVVNRGPAGLLDITPIPDRQYSDFLIHHGTQEEFDSWPNQIIAVDVHE